MILFFYLLEYCFCVFLHFLLFCELRHQSIVIRSVITLQTMSEDTILSILYDYAIKVKLFYMLFGPGTAREKLEEEREVC